MDQTPATTTEERVEDNIDWYFDVDKANRLKEILEEVFEQEAISKDIARMLFAKSDEFFRLEEVDHQRKVVMPEDWSEEAQRLCRKALVLEELISQRKEQETEVSAKEKHAKLDASAIERKENLGSLKDLRDRIHEYLKKKHHTTIDPTAYKKTWSLGKIKDQKYLGSLDWETDEALYKRLKEMWEEHRLLPIADRHENQKTIEYSPKK